MTEDPAKSCAIGKDDLNIMLEGEGTDPMIAIRVLIELNTNVASLSAFDIVAGEVEDATGESLHHLFLTPVLSSAASTGYDTTRLKAPPTVCRGPQYDNAN